uniref:hypothetical protein n=1 Tax=Serratia TaxID=613 RepID=UPI001F4C03E6|nr:MULTISPECIES: hypothetical protein [Serratia]ULG12050.1 hypothetical protein D1p1_00017 [Serratia entomophila]ULG12431.1 hypothetical protein M3p_00140 [Serratia entomophila]ULG18379.1 hypothetical protein Man4p_00061 [Serratia proteamaculans]ULG19648.1 hypothetical protein S-prot-1p1_00064 [Serratia proteamaculans]
MCDNKSLMETGNMVVTGESGSGKTVFGARVFLAQSSINHLKDIYTDEDKEKLAENVRKNCTFWLSLKPGGSQHDK